MSMKKILVIGSLNMDMVIKVHDMPLEGETVLGQEINYIPGGKGANQAYAVAKLGGRVSMIGKVGKDEFGESLCKSLKEAGTDITYVNKVSDATTGRAIIYVNEKGNNSIVVIAGANNNCNKEYLQSLQSVILDSDIIILQMEIPYDAIFWCINFAKEHNKTVIFNPAPAPDDLPSSIINKIDFITPNETELAKITKHNTDSEEEVITAAKILIDLGVKNVIVTLGSKGAMHVTSESHRMYPAIKVKAIDTTAAGDSFNGALSVYLAEGHTIEEAIQFAIRVASITVTRKGAQKSIPSRDEVNEIL